MALILFQKNESQKFIAPIDKNIIFNPLENKLQDFSVFMAHWVVVTSKVRVNIQRNLDGKEVYILFFCMVRMNINNIKE